MAGWSNWRRKSTFFPALVGQRITCHLLRSRRIAIYPLLRSKDSLAKILDVARYGPTYHYDIIHLPVGGIGEMFFKDKQRILSKRKVLIELALETGADIIPHYTFVVNETFLSTVWTLLHTGQNFVKALSFHLDLVWSLVNSYGFRCLPRADI
jgi:hypothetical protein